MHPDANLPVSRKVAVGRTFRATGVDTVKPDHDYCAFVRGEGILTWCCFQPKSISVQYGMSITQFFDMNADLRGMQENQAFKLDQVLK